MLVRSAMFSRMPVCMPQDSLQHVVNMVLTAALGATPVVDHHHRPVGLITMEDLATFTKADLAAMADVPVSQIIRGQRLVCCYEDDDVGMALLLMQTRRLRLLLVTDDIGRLTGVLTRDGVLDTEEYSAQRNADALRTLHGRAPARGNINIA
jgi:predicted transcriptional regulator